MLQFGNLHVNIAPVQKTMVHASAVFAALLNVPEMKMLVENATAKKGPIYIEFVSNTEIPTGASIGEVNNKQTIKIDKEQANFIRIIEVLVTSLLAAASDTKVPNAYDYKDENTYATAVETFQYQHSVYPSYRLKLALFTNDKFMSVCHVLDVLSVEYRENQVRTLKKTIEETTLEFYLQVQDKKLPNQTCSHTDFYRTYYRGCYNDELSQRGLVKPLVRAAEENNITELQKLLAAPNTVLLDDVVIAYNQVIEKVKQGKIENTAVQPVVKLLNDFYSKANKLFKIVSGEWANLLPTPYSDELFREILQSPEFKPCIHALNSEGQTLTQCAALHGQKAMVKILREILKPQQTAPQARSMPFVPSQTPVQPTPPKTLTYQAPSATAKKGTSATKPELINKEAAVTITNELQKKLNDRLKKDGTTLKK